MTSADQLPHLSDALLAFERVMQTAFTDQTERLITDHLERLVSRGAQSAGLANGLRETVSRNTVIEGLLDSAKFYTNQHISNNVMPRIYQAVEDFGTLGLSNKEFLTEIRDSIKVNLSNEGSKVRLTANGASSRAYHYGVVKAGFEVGHRTYVYDAILDDVTTAVCESLNGREFNVADAVSVAETRAAAAPEDIRTAAPWFTTEQIRDQNNQDLVQLGAILPPLHANCRSSIRLA